jgi:hypothetical protein
VPSAAPIDGYLNPSTYSAGFWAPQRCGHVVDGGSRERPDKQKPAAIRGFAVSHVVDTASDNVSTTVRHAAVVDIDDTLFAAGDNDG